jgi:MOSC domain-containing protein YiiM
MKYIDNLPQVGTLQWIGLRPARRATIAVVNDAEISNIGLVGDFFNGSAGSPRAVTLIQAEHLTVVASILGRKFVDPALLRRNLVVAGINLKSLKRKPFQIGSAILLGTGNCAPCSFMEEQLGLGGYNAMRGHGGITASIIQPGKIAVGDAVKFLPSVLVQGPDLNAS